MIFSQEFSTNEAFGDVMKIYIAGNQVCLKRGIDANRLRQYFELNQCQLVELPQDADVIVPIACAFIDSYAETAMEMIEELKAYDSRIVVLGCFPAMRPDSFATLGIKEFLSTKDLDSIDNMFPDFEVSFSSVQAVNFPDLHVMAPFSPKGSCPIAIRNNIEENKKPGPYLIISEGCASSCSYCSHPVALGWVKSKPLEQCVKEYQDLMDLGHKHVIIHANDPGSYGIDIGSSYPALLERLYAVTNWKEGVQWSLLDINPQWIAKYSERLADIGGEISIRAMGIPLQSASVRLLKKMKRYPFVRKLESCLELLRSRYSSTHFMTHLIAGFPGETMGDVQQTLEFVIRNKFGSVFLFPFSPNPMTLAADFADQLPGDEIVKRQIFMKETMEAAGVRVDVFKGGDD